MSEADTNKETTLEDVEKKIEKVEKKIEDELGYEEDLILGDVNDKNVVNTIVGTTIGFFVWFMWSKFVGVDPSDMSCTKTVKFEKLLIEPPSCKYDKCNTEEKIVVISTKEQYDKNRSFW